MSDLDELGLSDDYQEKDTGLGQFISKPMQRQFQPFGGPPKSQQPQNQQSQVQRPSPDSQPAYVSPLDTLDQYDQAKTNYAAVSREASNLGQIDSRWSGLYDDHLGSELQPFYDSLGLYDEIQDKKSGGEYVNSIDKEYNRLQKLSKEEDGFFSLGASDEKLGAQKMLKERFGSWDGANGMRAKYFKLKQERDTRKLMSDHASNQKIAMLEQMTSIPLEQRMSLDASLKNRGKGEKDPREVNRILDSMQWEDPVVDFDTGQIVNLHKVDPRRKSPTIPDFKTGANPEAVAQSKRLKAAMQGDIDTIMSERAGMNRRRLMQQRGFMLGHEGTAPRGLSDAFVDILDADKLKDAGFTEFNGMPIEDAINQLGGAEKLEAAKVMKGALQAKDIYRNAQLEFMQHAGGGPGHEEAKLKMEKARGAWFGSLKIAGDFGLSHRVYEQMSSTEDQVGFWEGWKNSIARGFAISDMAELSDDLLTNQADDSDLQELIRISQEIEDLPGSTAFKRLNETPMRNLWEAVGNILLDNPTAIPELITETLFSFFPTMVDTGVKYAVPGALGVGIVGKMKGKFGVKTAVGYGLRLNAGLASFSIEYASKIMEELDKMGVDKHDPKIVMAAWNSPVIRKGLKETALAKATGVGLMDAVGGLMAGKIGQATRYMGVKGGMHANATRWAKQHKRTDWQQAGIDMPVFSSWQRFKSSIGPETAAQMFTGTTGEYLGQYLAMKPGESFDHNAAAAEMVLEVVSPFGIYGAMNSAWKGGQRAADKKNFAEATPTYSEAEPLMENDQQVGFQGTVTRAGLTQPWKAYGSSDGLAADLIQGSGLAFDPANPDSPENRQAQFLQDFAFRVQQMNPKRFGELRWVVAERTPDHVDSEGFFEHDPETGGSTIFLNAELIKQNPIRGIMHEAGHYARLDIFPNVGELLSMYNSLPEELKLNAFAEYYLKIPNVKFNKLAEGQQADVKSRYDNTPPRIQAEEWFDLQFARSLAGNPADRTVAQPLKKFMKKFIRPLMEGWMGDVKNAGDMAAQIDARVLTAMGWGANGTRMGDTLKDQDWSREGVRSAALPEGMERMSEEEGIKWLHERIQEYDAKDQKGIWAVLEAMMGSKFLTKHTTAFAPTPISKKEAKKFSDPKAAKTYSKEKLEAAKQILEGDDYAAQQQVEAINLKEEQVYGAKQLREWQDPKAKAERDNITRILSKNEGYMTREGELQKDVLEARNAKVWKLLKDADIDYESLEGEAKNEAWDNAVRQVNLVSVIREVTEFDALIEFSRGGFSQWAIDLLGDLTLKAMPNAESIKQGVHEGKLELEEVQAMLQSEIEGLKVEMAELEASLLEQQKVPDRQAKRQKATGGTKVRGTYLADPAKDVGQQVDFKTLAWYHKGVITSRAKFEAYVRKQRSDEAAVKKIMGFWDLLKKNTQISKKGNNLGWDPRQNSFVLVTKVDAEKLPASKKDAKKNAKKDAKKDVVSSRDQNTIKHSLISAIQRQMYTAEDAPKNPEEAELEFIAKMAQSEGGEMKGAFREMNTKFLAKSGHNYLFISAFLEALTKSEGIVYKVGEMKLGGSDRFLRPHELMIILDHGLSLKEGDRRMLVPEFTDEGNKESEVDTYRAAQSFNQAASKLLIPMTGKKNKDGTYAPASRDTMTYQSQVKNWEDHLKKLRQNIKSKFPDLDPKDQEKELADQLARVMRVPVAFMKLLGADEKKARLEDIVRRVQLLQEAEMLFAPENFTVQWDSVHVTHGNWKDTFLRDISSSGKVTYAPLTLGHMASRSNKLRLFKKKDGRWTETTSLMNPQSSLEGLYESLKLGYKSEVEGKVDPDKPKPAHNGLTPRQYKLYLAAAVASMHSPAHGRSVITNTRLRDPVMQGTPDQGTTLLTMLAKRIWDLNQGDALAGKGRAKMSTEINFSPEDYILAEVSNYGNLTPLDQTSDQIRHMWLSYNKALELGHLITATEQGKGVKNEDGTYKIRPETDADFKARLAAYEKNLNFLLHAEALDMMKVSGSRIELDPRNKEHLKMLKDKYLLQKRNWTGVGDFPSLAKWINEKTEKGNYKNRWTVHSAVHPEMPDAQKPNTTQLPGGKLWSGALATDATSDKEGFMYSHMAAKAMDDILQQWRDEVGIRGGWHKMAADKYDKHRKVIAQAHGADAEKLFIDDMVLRRFERLHGKRTNKNYKEFNKFADPYKKLYDIPRQSAKLAKLERDRRRLFREEFGERLGPEDPRVDLPAPRAKMSRRQQQQAIEALDQDIKAERASLREKAAAKRREIFALYREWMEDETPAEHKETMETILFNLEKHFVEQDIETREDGSVAYWPQFSFNIKHYDGQAEAAAYDFPAFRDEGYQYVTLEEALDDPSVKVAAQEGAHKEFRRGNVDKPINLIAMYLRQARKVFGELKRSGKVPKGSFGQKFEVPDNIRGDKGRIEAWNHSYLGRENLTATIMAAAAEEGSTVNFTGHDADGHEVKVKAVFKDGLWHDQDTGEALSDRPQDEAIQISGGKDQEGRIPMHVFVGPSLHEQASHAWSKKIDDLGVMHEVSRSSEFHYTAARLAQQIVKRGLKSITNFPDSEATGAFTTPGQQFGPFIIQRVLHPLLTQLYKDLGIDLTAPTRNSTEDHPQTYGDLLDQLDLISKISAQAEAEPESVERLIPMPTEVRMGPNMGRYDFLRSWFEDSEFEGGFEGASYAFEDREETSPEWTETLEGGSVVTHPAERETDAEIDFKNYERADIAIVFQVSDKANKRTDGIIADLLDSGKRVLTVPIWQKDFDIREVAKRLRTQLKVSVGTAGKVFIFADSASDNNNAKIKATLDYIFKGDLPEAKRQESKDEDEGKTKTKGKPTVVHFTNGKNPDLSPFHTLKNPIIYKENRFYTVEAAYQAHKNAEKAKDEEWVEQFTDPELTGQAAQEIAREAGVKADIETSNSLMRTLYRLRYDTDPIFKKRIGGIRGDISHPVSDKHWSVELPKILKELSDLSKKSRWFEDSDIWGDTYGSFSAWKSNFGEAMRPVITAVLNARRIDILDQRPDEAMREGVTRDSRQESAQADKNIFTTSGEYHAKAAEEEAPEGPEGAPEGTEDQDKADSDDPGTTQTTKDKEDKADGDTKFQPDYAETQEERDEDAPKGAGERTRQMRALVNAQALFGQHLLDVIRHVKPGPNFSENEILAMAMARAHVDPDATLDDILPPGTSMESLDITPPPAPSSKDFSDKIGDWFEQFSESDDPKVSRYINLLRDNFGRGKHTAAEWAKAVSDLIEELQNPRPRNQAPDPGDPYSNLDGLGSHLHSPVHKRNLSFLRGGNVDDDDVIQLGSSLPPMTEADMLRKLKGKPDGTAVPLGNLIESILKKMKEYLKVQGKDFRDPNLNSRYVVLDAFKRMYQNRKRWENKHRVYASPMVKEDPRSYGRQRVILRSESDMEGAAGKIDAHTSGNDFTIALSRDWLWDAKLDTDPYDTLIHEMFHGLTHRFVKMAREIYDSKMESGIAAMNQGLQLRLQDGENLKDSDPMAPDKYSSAYMNIEKLHRIAKRKYNQILSSHPDEEHRFDWEKKIGGNLDDLHYGMTAERRDGKPNDQDILVEFITEAASNPVMMKFLDSIELTDKQAKNLGMTPTEGSKSTLWQVFVDIIRRYFNLKADNTVLSHTLREVSNFVEQQPEDKLAPAYQQYDDKLNPVMDGQEALDKDMNIFSPSGEGTQLGSDMHDARKGNIPRGKGFRPKHTEESEKEFLPARFTLTDKDELWQTLTGELSWLTGYDDLDTEGLMKELGMNPEWLDEANLEKLPANALNELLKKILWNPPKLLMDASTTTKMRELSMGLDEFLEYHNLREEDINWYQVRQYLRQLPVDPMDKRMDRAARKTIRAGDPGPYDIQLGSQLHSDSMANERKAGFLNTLFSKDNWKELYNETKEGVKSTKIGWKETGGTWDRLKLDYVDKFRPIKNMFYRVQKIMGDVHMEKGSPLYDALNSWGKIHTYLGLGHNELEQAQIKYHAPIMDAIRDSGVSVKDVGRYLLARMAPSRNKHHILQNKDALKDVKNIKDPKKRAEKRKALTESIKNKAMSGIADDVALKRVLKLEKDKNFQKFMNHKNNPIQLYYEQQMEDITNRAAQELIDPEETSRMKSAASYFDWKKAGSKFKFTDSDGKPSNYSYAPMQGFEQELQSMVDEERGWQILGQATQSAGKGFDQPKSKLMQKGAFGRDEDTREPDPEIVLGVAEQQFVEGSIRANKNRVSNSFGQLHDMMRRIAFGQEEDYDTPSQFQDVDLDELHKNEVLRDQMKAEYNKYFKTHIQTVDKKEYTWDDVDPSGRWKMVEKRINTDFANDPHVFVYRKQGVPVYIQFQETPDGKLMAASLKNMRYEALPELLRGINWATRFMSQMATSRNPAFIIPNFIRDFATALINLGEDDKRQLIKYALNPKNIKMFGAAIFKAELSLRKDKKSPIDTKGFKGGSKELAQEIFRENDPVKMYMFAKANGAMVGYFNAKGVPDIVRGMIKESSKIAGPPKRMWEKTVAYMDALNSIAEQSIRISSFWAAIENGRSTQEAALTSRRVTVDFNQGGNKASAMNAMYMFFRASISGMERAFSTIKKRTPKERIALIGGIAGASYMVAMLSRILDDDDDEDTEPTYDQVNSYVRHRKLVLPVPSWLLNVLGMEDEGFHLRFDLPLGVGASIWGVGQQLADLTAYYTPGMRGGAGLLETISNTAGTLQDMTNPMGGVGIQELVPSFIKPFTDIKANKNFMGKTIVYEQSPWGDPVPAHMRDPKSTPEAWTEFSRMINKWGGGTDQSFGSLRGSLGMNPLEYKEDEDWKWDWSGNQMRHVVMGYLIGPAQFLERTVLTAHDAASSGAEVDLGKVPIVQRFVRGSTYGGNTRNKLYNLRDAVFQAENVVQKAKPEVRAYEKKRQHKLMQFLPAVKNVDRVLNKVRDQKQAVRDSNDTPFEKSHRIADLEAKELELISRLINRAQKAGLAI